MYTVIYRVYKIDLDITIVMDVPKRGQQGDVFAVVRSSSRRGVSHKARERYMAINRSVKHGRLSCNVTIYSSSSMVPWSCSHLLPKGVLPEYTRQRGQRQNGSQMEGPNALTQSSFPNPSWCDDQSPQLSSRPSAYVVLWSCECVSKWCGVTLN